MSTTPFRDEEMQAQARVLRLREEQTELRAKRDELRDRVGENRDGFVSNLERQVDDLRAEKKRLESLTPKDQPPPVELTRSRILFTYAIMFFIGFAAALLANMMHATRVQ